MSFWRKPTTLGDLLVQAGLCTQADIKAALTFQGKNPDTMLGEALVHLEIISRDQLELMLARQEVARSNGSGKGVAKVAAIATQRLKRLATRAEDMLSHPPPEKVGAD